MVKRIRMRRNHPRSECNCEASVPQFPVRIFPNEQFDFYVHRVEAFWLGLPDAPPRVVASVVHPQWRDSSRDNPWKVHFWPDGKFWKEDPRPKHAKGRARQTIQYSGMWAGSGGGEFWHPTQHDSCASSVKWLGTARREFDVASGVAQLADMIK